MFYIVIIPVALDNLTLVIIAAILNLFLAAIVFYYAFVTTKIDPTDKTCYLEHEAKLKGYEETGFDIN